MINGRCAQIAAISPGPPTLGENGSIDEGRQNSRKPSGECQRPPPASAMKRGAPPQWPDRYKPLAHSVANISALASVGGPIRTGERADRSGAGPGEVRDQGARRRDWLQPIPSIRRARIAGLQKGATAVHSRLNDPCSASVETTGPGVNRGPGRRIRPSLSLRTLLCRWAAYATICEIPPGRAFFPPVPIPNGVDPGPRSGLAIRP